MMSVAADQFELDQQREFLCAKIGETGSGAIRYAAAMYFYNLDMMPTRMLEIYRACSKFDREDPIAVAKFEGIELASPHNTDPLGGKS